MRRIVSVVCLPLTTIMPGSTAFSDKEYRMIESFKTHFEVLSKYFAAYLVNAPPNLRSSASQQLARLMMHQFHELSTDVYEELMRRQYASTVPLPPARNDFHPRRN
ncbi:hypothetical protein CPB85DRAFT_111778 [Mucidula mucida]|nr:hypothetical protein CPB85DRAFT_111778 [Mucidula mucida]